MDGAPTRSYGVKLVRGPFLRLEPHPDVVEDHLGATALAARLRQQNPGVRLAADLFCGGGGLSLGLSRAGFTPVVAVDHYAEAVETHRHHFAGLSVDWDLADPDRVEELARLLRELQVDLIAGGPPCQPFSKAGRSGIRHAVLHQQRDPHDQRRDLWRSFMETIRLVQPPAVLMENVPDMALDKEMFILRAMVEELESLGYAVEERVVESWRYGVPQFRQRLILVALRDGVAFDWPAEAESMVTVSNALGELPEVDGGFRHEVGAGGFHAYPGPVTEFQRLMRAEVSEDEQDRLYDHITRPVRDDDRAAFELMGSETRYSDLPEEYKRYRDDIFDDKYKRLDEHGLSRTITAHIAKDGYWYIHPRQSRTITVREAARLQTFPDHYRFAGPPSAAFKQIGNAVPPLLAQRLGEAVLAALEEGVPAAMPTRELSRILGSWFRASPARSVPWLKAESRWQVVSAEMLLERSAAGVVGMAWAALERWRTPEATVAEGEQLRDLAQMMGRGPRAVQLLELADWLLEHPGALEEPDTTPGGIPVVSESVLDLAALVVPAEDQQDEPVLATRGVLRVAARVTGEAVDVKNRLTDGRLAVARLVGYGPFARDAHLALIEIAFSLCRPTDTACDLCPLAAHCVSSRAELIREETLFSVEP